NSGQYDKAVEEFQAAYLLRPSPLLLFNLAQAHRKAGHSQQALDLYERFLREQPETDLRAETEGYIAEVKAAIAADKEARDKPAREKAEREAAEKAARALKDRQREPAPAVAAPISAPPPPPPPRRSPYRVAKWVLLGAGVAAIAAGAALIAVDGRPTCDLAP